MDETLKVILHKYSNCTIAMEILRMESTCDDRPVLQSLHCMVLNILLQYIVVMPYIYLQSATPGCCHWWTLAASVIHITNVCSRCCGSTTKRCSSTTITTTDRYSTNICAACHSTTNHYSTGSTWCHQRSNCSTVSSSNIEKNYSHTVETLHVISTFKDS